MFGEARDFRDCYREIFTIKHTLARGGAKFKSRGGRRERHSDGIIFGCFHSKPDCVTDDEMSRRILAEYVPI